MLVVDNSSVPLGAAGSFKLDLADGQAPSVQGAAAVSPTEIRVAFDEPVSAAGFGGAGWSVSGGDAAGLAVNSSSDISAGSTELALFLDDGGLPDTAPDNATLSYDPGSGGVSDAADNYLGLFSMPVGDGIAPSVLSAAAVSRTEIRIELSEPVSAAGTGGAGWSVSGGDAAGLAVNSSSDISAGSTELALFLDDGGLPDTAPDNATLSYDPESGGGAADQAGNALGRVDGHGIGDGIAPEIDSARITGPLSIAISYSEPVAAGQSAYAWVEIDGDSIGSIGIGSRNATLSSANGIAVHVLRIGAEGEDAAAAASDATGTLVVDQTLLADAAGNMLGSDVSFAQ